MTIEILIDDAYSHLVSPDLFSRCASATLRHGGVTESADLTVVVTGNAQVRGLNHTYRGVDAVTDVLAFADEEGGGFVTPPDYPRYLGDVVISFQQAAKQARDAGHPVEAELQLLTVHGILHLLGYDHADADQQAAMWTAQATVLGTLDAFERPSSA